METDLIYKKSAAARLGFSPRHLDYLIANGLVPYRRVAGRGTQGRIAFTDADIRAIIDSWSAGPAKARAPKPPHKISTKRGRG